MRYRFYVTRSQTRLTSPARGCGLYLSGNGVAASCQQRLFGEIDIPQAASACVHVMRLFLNVCCVCDAVDRMRVACRVHSVAFSVCNLLNGGLWSRSFVRCPVGRTDTLSGTPNGMTELTKCATRIKCLHCESVLMCADDDDNVSYT